MSRPVTALIRPAMDGYLAVLGVEPVRPMVEPVSLALGPGICLASVARDLASH